MKPFTLHEMTFKDYSRSFATAQFNRLYIILNIFIHHKW